MRLSWLLNVLFVNAFAHLIHLDLFMQNLANRLLFLLALDVTSHLESTVLFLERLELLLILYFFLS